MLMAQCCSYHAGVHPFLFYNAKSKCISRDPRFKLSIEVSYLDTGPGYWQVGASSEESNARARSHDMWIGKYLTTNDFAH